MRYLLGAMVLALTLTGCAWTVAEPAPPAGVELQVFVEEQEARADGTYSGPTESDYDLNGNDCLEQAQAFLDTVDVTAVSDAEVLRLSALFESEMSRCKDGVVLTPNEAGFYSTAQLDFIYDYFQDSLVPCLQLQGLDVGFAPNRSDFSAFAGSISWDPYSELGADLPPSRTAEIMVRCPQLPAAGFLAAQ